jgi:HK97 gp10 family phage protein
MMAGSFQITKNQLPAVRTALRVTAPATMKEVATEARDEARRLAPKDTGDLVKGIKVRRIRGGWSVVSLMFYGHFHEFGTVRLPARPFMTPAGERAVAKLKRRLSKVVTEAVR